MIKTVKVIIILMVSLIFLCACQPNPDNSAVVNKGDDSFEEAIAKTAPTSQIIISPQDTDNTAEEIRWVESLVISDNITIEINAKVVAPQTKRLPVIQVKPVPFRNEEDFAGMIEAVLPGAELYKYSEIKTKSQIEKNILEFKSRLHDAEQDKQPYVIENIDYYKEQIALLEEQYPTAPDVRPTDPPEYKFVKGDDGNYFELETIYNDIHYSILFNNDNYLSNLFWIDSDYGNNYTNEASCKIYSPDEIADSNFQKAVEMGNTIIKRLGIDDYMKLNAATIDGEMAGQFTYPYTIDEKGYTLYYEFAYDNIPETCVINYEGTTGFADGAVYRDLWGGEVINISIYDGKLAGFSWHNRSEIAKVENDNVAMLSWEEIQEAFRKHAKHVYSNPMNGGQSFQITKAVLGLTKVIIKNTSDGYRLVPTWTFFGNKKSAVLNDEEYVIYTAIMTLNAIDGNPIDRGLMY